MNPKAEIINYRLSRARETYEDAKILFQNNKLFSSVNRIYYAMFYCVSALLFSKGLSSSKHIGVIELFNKEFVKKGIVDKHLGKFYFTMFEMRQKGDYKDLVEFHKEDVERWLDEAEKFIEIIEKITHKMIPSECEKRARN